MIGLRSLHVVAFVATSSILAVGCGGGGGGRSGGSASVASTASGTIASISSGFTPIGRSNVAALTSSSVPIPSASTTGSFSLVSPLQQGRVFHTASTLPSGQVLIVGGQTGPALVTGTTELFDSSTGTVTAGPALATARMNHAAVILPTGELLVIGGQSDTACQQTLGSTEILSPGATAFAAGPSLASSRSNPAVAVYLDQGGSWKVLVAGGASLDSGALASLDTAEVIDVTTKAVTPAPANLTQDVAGAQAISLGNGQVLIQGGYTQIASGTPVVASSEVLDMNAGTVTQIGLSPDSAEGALVQILGPTGPVFAIGGTDGQSPLGSIQSLEGGAWTSTPISLTTPRRGFSAAAVTLPSGPATLVIGGFGTAGALGSSELTTVTTAVASSPLPQAPALAEARGYAATAVLPSGDVITTGGTDGTDILASIEVFSTSGVATPGAGSTLGPLVALSSSGAASATPIFNGATFWNGVAFGTPAPAPTPPSASTTVVPGSPGAFGLPADPNDSEHLGFALGVVNAARAASGLPALTLDTSLCTVALEHATDDASVHWNDGSGGFCHDWNGGDRGTSTAENAAAGPLHGGHHGGGLGGFGVGFHAPSRPADRVEADFVRATRRMLSPITLAIETQLVAQNPGVSPNFAGGSSELVNLTNPTATAIGFGFYVDQASGRLIIVEDIR